MLAGSLDAAYMGPNSAITAYSQGNKSIRVVSGATSGGAALVVAKSITSPSQLKGKTLATPQLGNTQDVALRTWLKKQGLTFPGPNGGSGDVTILPQDNSTTLTSFESGAIAGAWVPEPWVQRMVSEGGGHILVNEKTQWPKGLFSTTCLVVTTSLLKDHPDVVQDLLEGQVATTTYLNTHSAPGRPGGQHPAGHPDGEGPEGQRAHGGVVRHDLHQRPHRLVVPGRRGPRQGRRVLDHQHLRAVRPRARSTRCWWPTISSR